MKPFIETIAEKILSNEQALDQFINCDEFWTDTEFCRFVAQDLDVGIDTLEANKIRQMLRR